MGLSWRRVQVAVAVVVVAAIVLGVLARIWYLSHEPLNADEAVVGLMARRILAGHASAFYWGQSYGGVEPYLVAALFWVAGPSALVLRLAPVLLAAVSCLVLWRVARRLVGDPALAALAAAWLWAAPQSAVWNTTLEYGFRGVTMVCGLLLLLLALRVTSRPAATWDLVALGLVAGIGWWSSPEIAYFAVPSGLWLAAWLCRGRRTKRSSGVEPAPCSGVVAGPASVLAEDVAAGSGAAPGSGAAVGSDAAAGSGVGAGSGVAAGLGTVVAEGVVPASRGATVRAPARPAHANFRERQAGQPGWRWWVLAVAAGAGGAFPWLWNNVGSGLASLRVSTYYVPSAAPGYVGRLGDVVRGAIPLLLDLRVPGSGSWVVPVPVAVAVGVVATAVVVGCAGLSIARRGHGPALVLGVAAFPFLLALVPGMWLWQSGRYAVFLVPLVLLVVVVGADEAAGSRRRALRSVATGGPAGAAVATGGPAGAAVATGGPAGAAVATGGPAGAAVATGQQVRRFAARPGGRPRPMVVGLVTIGLALAVASSAVVLVDTEHGLVPAGVSAQGAGPDHLVVAMVRNLQAAGVVDGYADYWVAYMLDFFGYGRLRFADSPPSPDRWPRLLAEVRRQPADHQAWLFVAPTAAAQAQFARSPIIRGPSGLPEAAFLGRLRAMHVPYRRLVLGSVDAVVPDRPITFAAVGLRPHG